MGLFLDQSIETSHGKIHHMERTQQRVFAGKEKPLFWKIKGDSKVCELLHGGAVKWPPMHGFMSNFAWKELL